jgi:hypothetical protein
MLSHDIAIELLPWLVNDSLAGDEKLKVLAHARTCVICRRELDDLERLRGALLLSSTAPPLPEPDMRNINAQIDRLINRQNWWRNFVSRVRNTPNYSWRTAFAVQSILLIVVAGLFLWPNPESQEFTTLTQPGDLPDGHYVRLVLSPAYAESELSTMLEQYGLEVVKGPSPGGVYTLGLADTLSNVDRDKLVLTLQEDPRVLFAQPVTRQSGK